MVAAVHFGPPSRSSAAALWLPLLLLNVELEVPRQDWNLIALRGAGAQVYKCHADCEVCHLFDFDMSWHCLQCKPGFELWVDGCFEPCGVGEYRYGYRCEPCTYNCHACVGTMRHECTQCSDGYEFDIRRLCVKKCSLGQYPTIDGRSCGECNAYCQTCISEYRISCKSCFEGYTLRILEDNTSTGECMQNCDPGFFRDASNDMRCIQCGEFCEACESLESCSECQSNATLSRGICYLQPNWAEDTAVDFEAYMSSGAGMSVDINDPNKPTWEDLYERRLMDDNCDGREAEADAECAK